MNKITINVHVPKAAAIASKSALWGDTTYEPSPEEIGELTTEQATMLLHYEGEGAQRLQLESYSPEFWPLMKAALSKAIVEACERALQRAEKSSARIKLHTWACSQTLFPALREAALRDYDIGTRYVFELGRLLADADLELNGRTPSIITCTEQLATNVKIEPRQSPSLYSMTLESRLKVVLGHTEVAPGTVVELSGVARMTPTHGERQTVITATIAHPAAGVGVTVIWSAEDHRTIGQSIAELRYEGPEA